MCCRQGVKISLLSVSLLPFYVLHGVVMTDNHVATADKDVPVSVNVKQAIKFNEELAVK